VCILIVASILRLIFLDRVPTAIGGDELSYILTVKYIALTGSDILGNWSPLSIFAFSYPSGYPQAELPYFLLYPTSFFPSDLFSVRIIYSFLSIGSVLLIYLLSKTIFNNRVGLIAAMLAAINPWLVFTGRTNYEVVPATFFFLLGIYLLLKFKDANILLVIPVFLLAFYSYIGTKVAFVPIIAIASYVAFLQNKKKFAKFYILINIAAIALVTVFAFSISNGQNRAGELFTPFSADVAAQVDEIRKDSVSGNVLTNIFENKYTIYLKIAAAKVLNIFSPDYLFFRTDNFIGLYRHGLFYYIDAVFLALGIIYLSMRKRRRFFFISAFLIAAMLPEIMFTARVDIFSHHLPLFFVTLIIIIAVGIDAFMARFKQKLVPFILGFIYLLLFVNFLNIYFSQYPMQGHFDFGSRVLSNYVARVSANGSKVTLHVKNPEDAYRKYLFYTDAVREENISEIRESFITHSPSLKNIKFMTCPEIDTKQKPENLTIYQISLCEDLLFKEEHLEIARLTDGGGIYRIYNDEFCSKFNLKQYPSNVRHYQFAPEKLSDDEFCSAFITQH